MTGSDAPLKNPLRAAVHEAYLAACLGELKALKPGNVHDYADGHHMDVADFKTSARVSAAAMCDPDLSVGERIFKSIEATGKAVGCNTNLGIILLCAPLTHCVMTGAKGGNLREKLGHVLDNLTRTDARLAYRAIALASPAGLGEHDRHDVHQEPTITLKAAMEEAASFDRIAYQYAHGFKDVFETGVTTLRENLEKGQPQDWAMTCAFMAFLSRFNDSHIERKYSITTAKRVRLEALPLEKALKKTADPSKMTADLIKFDKNLKKMKINPGTSADLTVAGLLAVKLEDIVPRSNSL